MLALVAVLAGLGGCGNSESKAATEALHAFLAASARGDGPAACEQLSEAGVSELLLIGLEQEAELRRDPGRASGGCARAVEGLDMEPVDALRRSPVTEVLLHGEKATIATEAGHYEVEERDGRWRVSRFEPLAVALERGTIPDHPVGVTVVHPEFNAPALGASVAKETSEDELELSGVLDPANARLTARAIEGGVVERVHAADGRFRVWLSLEPGANVFLLRAAAPGREPAELSVRVRRR